MNSVVGRCASCNERKETPLRVGFMGGYVCLSCVDARLQSDHDLIASQAADIERLTKERDEALALVNYAENVSKEVARLSRYANDTASRAETAERLLADATVALADLDRSLDDTIHHYSIEAQASRTTLSNIRGHNG